MAGSLGPIPLPEAGQKRSGLFTFQADPELARYQWPFFSIAGPTGTQNTWISVTADGSRTKMVMKSEDGGEQIVQP